MYNMFVQTGGIIASNIYRADDAPGYKRGNSVLLAIISVNIFLYAFTKWYYVTRNSKREAKWNAFTEDEKWRYLDEKANRDRGNKRLDFRFAH
jgi:hypothetical protein